MNANNTPESFEIQDLFIIGGGINGCGIAYDAAGRGLSVTLCEMGDLAEETSSYSSKLIHGGLRYLESYEFRLVHEALKEREVLLKIAPHLVHPLRIIMPHDQHHRPAWMIRTGLFIYDHLSFSQSLPKTKTLKINSNDPAEPLNSKTKLGFSYSDCTVDDARLVLHLALGAKENNARILTHHRVEKITRGQHPTTQESCFIIDILHGHEKKQFFSKAVINAAGPWVDEVIKNKTNFKTKHHIQQVQGSHLIIKKLYPGPMAYILQNDDKRIIFVIPYRENFTLIGTTDVPYEGDPHEVKISQEEINYLIQCVNLYFKKNISPEDIIYTYAGVRPLQKLENTPRKNPSQVTRDYIFEIDAPNQKLPMLSIFGGKITTYRKLAEHALEKLKPYFPKMGSRWTETKPLPGGSFQDFNILVKNYLTQYPFLTHSDAYRIAYAYGTRGFDWLKNAQTKEALGLHFGHGLYEAEVKFMIQKEWAQSAQDILWRRSKFILQFSDQERKALEDYIYK